MTWDQDNDPLDIEIVNVTEPLVPGSVVELRVIGVMKFIDGGEVDDKIIAVLAGDKRQEHITHMDQLGEYFKTKRNTTGRTTRPSRSRAPASSANS